MNRFRFRIPFTCAILCLIGQILLLFSVWVVAGYYQRNLTEEILELEAYDVQAKAENVADILSLMRSALNAEEIVNYTETSTATYSRAEIENLANRAGSFLDALSLPENVVEKVIFIGSSYDKTAYIKTIGGEGELDWDLPNMAQLRMARFLEWDRIDSDEWVYYPEGSLTMKLDELTRTEDMTISDSLRSGILGLLSHLDGKLVLSTTSAYGGSQVFFVCNPDFPASFGVDSEVSVALLLNDVTVYDNSRKEGDGSTGEQGVLGSILNGENTLRREISLDITGFKILLEASAREIPFSEEILRSCILWSLLLWLGGTAFSVFWGWWIIHPVLKMRRSFDTQFRNRSYEKIPSSKVGQISFARLLAAFVVCVLLPVIAGGIHAQRRLEREFTLQNTLYTEKLTETVSENLENEKATILLAGKLFPNDQIASFIQGDSPLITAVKNRLELAYGESDFFSHYAIFNKDGSEIYNSSTAYGSETLTIDWDERIVTSLGTCYLQLTPDNQTGNGAKRPALVFSITTGREEHVVPRVVGYFVMYLNTTRLNSLRPGVGHELVLTGKDGSVLLSTISSNGDDWANSLSAGAVSEQYRVTEGEGIFGGKLLLYSDMRYYSEMSYRIRADYYLIFMCISLAVLTASFFLARRIASPLKAIGESMALGADDGNFRPVHYVRRDEVASLVESYNKMVDRIDALMEENARRASREHELETMRARTELRMLETQINPHLLYNTLEFIDYNARREGANAAGDMAVALASFFRYTTAVKEDIVPLASEIAHAENYIAIHRLRFGERFDTEISVSEEAGTTPVIKFILQPLVENAFKYGIADKLHGALISISAFIEGEKLTIRVYDNGTGLRPAKLAELRAKIENTPPEQDDAKGGVGLVNVKKRLEMYYRDQAEMELNSSFMHGFEVILRVPIEK